ncbi:DUF2690 domain-containing protein [Streptomyces sp. ISL-112]|uniref:helix-turn-helix domain-containing protein n=1 Tax=unclassified Streptomyces TaxID=2593676 RepID=UPI001BEC7827|nr:MULTISPECIES: XRE family transcriptional regulator [unclassified Streptomyces]MBT2424585.1 DUF2690 domain-containing protein [Streptomyces sp. ISL-112]MBT2465120.1 DUF2690 domain-containing protein [Streptomyces sp. ISL-63]
MPRWKALPEELDPQIREFASRLRGLVDRSGLNINAVADRTGFSEMSWERYLDGRLLPPRRAVMALADVTSTPQHHLTTMWELADRAWSRAEMRHDRTIEAIRITQAREALGATDPAGGDRNGPGRSADGRHSAAGSAATGAGGGHGPDGYGPDADRRQGHGTDAYGTVPHRTDVRAPFVPTQRGTVPPVPQQRQGGRRVDAQLGGGAPGRATGGRSKAIPLAVGAAGAVIVIVGAVMLTPSGDEPAKAILPPTAAPTTAPTTAEPAPEPPAGVECQGADCAGRNPDEMGCGGDHARTVSTAQVGAARVEVRYSEVCSAAWARLTEAGTGDTVTITGGAAAAAQNGEVTVAEAYTPMVAVKKAADAKACATLTAGTKGCTT